MITTPATQIPLRKPCPDSLRIIGRPDRVALWIADSGLHMLEWEPTNQKRDEYLEDLASQLRDHHEESDI